MVLIGIIGKKFSGKSTITDWIKSNIQNSIELAFATPLKEEAIFWGFPYDYVYGNKKEEVYEPYGISFREWAQKRGDQIRCSGNFLKGKVYDNAFIHRVHTKYSELKDTNHVIVSDVRFIDEAIFIKDQKGYLIKILRDVPDNEFSNHSSEIQQEIIKADFNLDNNGKLEDTFSTLGVICQDILFL